MCALLLCLGACGGEAVETPDSGTARVHPCADNRLARQALTGTPHHTLIFVDRSSSASGTEALYADTLQARIKADLIGRRSQLGVYLVHDRTTGLAGQRVFTQDVPPPAASKYDNENRQRCVAYAKKVEGAMVQTWRAAAPMLDADVADANRGGTDLWGVLEVASDAFATSPDSALKRVYVFSDLLECMPGAGRRCFEARPPRSRQEAETWARADAERVQRELRVRPEVLRDVRFALLSGAHANRDETRFAGYYWHTLLETLGVPPGQVRVG